MKYGYFNKETKEYIITNPKTPVKWINYIGELSFGGFIDQTGGALLCKGDPALNRITKYIPQLPDSDFKGTTLYIRVFDQGKVNIFSPFFVPTIDPYESYRCHVGLGYSRVISDFYGIQTDVTIFIPLGESLEVRDIKITNLRKNAIDLDVIPVVEFTHPNALLQFTNADWIPQTMQSEAIRDEGKLILLQYPFMNKDVKMNYFTSSYEASSFETNRRLFIGDNGYGSWRKPLALQSPELSNTEALRGDNIGALMHHFTNIKPNETRRLITQLGQNNDRNSILTHVKKFRNPVIVDQALMDLHDFWDVYLSKIKIETPDENVDNILNVHNPRQIFITNNWSRYLSLYQLGFGSRGIGFRDSAQDTLGITSHDPESARVSIRKLLLVQRPDGSAMHSYNPLTMVGSVGDSQEMEDRPKFYSDDHLWVILAVCAYLKETRDFNFLQEEIPFYNENRNDGSNEIASVLDHIRRGLNFTKVKTGVHGLPLLGFADWNDTVNLRQGAESVFTAFLYGKALNEMIQLSPYINELDYAGKYQVEYDKIKDIVNRTSWDGEWYVRYFDSDGIPLGSKNNSHGKIFTNAQSWAVISGFASLERSETALNSVNRYLNTSKGIKLSTPGYNGYDPKIGGVSTYPPGAKENGGIFLHANPWVIIAETLVGHGDRAFEYFSQINPAAKNLIIDEYESEPYVYPQNILGDEHPQFGLARNPWLTGTASWAYQAAVKFILGIQPTYDGLRIDPCIPKKWNGFKITREFRNAVYEITVENPDHISKGVRAVMVDNEEIHDIVLPVFKDQKTHPVNVILGDN